MEKDARRRYATAGEMGEDLRRFLRSEPIQARPAGPLEQTRRWARRHAGWAAGASVMIFSLGFLRGPWVGEREDLAAQAGMMRTEERHAGFGDKRVRRPLLSDREGARIPPYGGGLVRIERSPGRAHRDPLAPDWQEPSAGFAVTMGEALWIRT